jgi:UDP-3-O-[3-hydroxymyristoyl] N-acetylglucosamine deacetylase
MITSKATLKKEIGFSGVGVHSGTNVRIRLIPSSGGKIVFRRTDLDDHEVNLDIRHVEGKNCSLIVTPEGTIQTIEHLLAVLYAFSVDSVIISMDGGEIPAMDGSAKDFAEAVARVGLDPLEEKKQYIKVIDTIRVEHEDAFLTIGPDKGFRISYSIEFDHPAIGSEKLSLLVDSESFLKEIAPARTFGFLSDLDSLMSQGLAQGGSLDNAVVLDYEKVINGPLRFPDEFVRHKALDLIGDLALMGSPLLAHVSAYKAGHSLHQRAASYLLDHHECYEVVTF